jgi:hypothetical protein
VVDKVDKEANIWEGSRILRLIMWRLKELEKYLEKDSIISSEREGHIMVD